MRLFALVSGLAALAATPSLALTISSAPPSRDAAQHLRSSDTSGAPRLQDGWAGGGRPATSQVQGSSFSNGSIYSNSTSYGFGGVQTTIRNGDQDPRWTSDRRDTPAPLGLSPRR